MQRGSTAVSSDRSPSQPTSRCTESHRRRHCIVAVSYTQTTLKSLNLPVEGAGATRIDLGTDHVTSLSRVGRIEGRICEVLTDELVVRQALVHLRFEILAGTVLEHVLTTAVSGRLRAIGGSSRRDGVVDVLMGWSSKSKGGYSQGEHGVEKVHLAI
jgi:hypothetical protein